LTEKTWMLTSKIKRAIAIRMEVGDDILRKIAEVCRKEQVESGFFCAIGAATKITYAVYSIEERAYKETVAEGFFEITSCVGNVATVVDDRGEPVDLFVHAHINFADHSGRVFGGHLREGSSVWGLGEVFLFETEETLKRLRSEIEAQGFSPWRT